MTPWCYVLGAASFVIIISGTAFILASVLMAVEWLRDRYAVAAKLFAAIGWTVKALIACAAIVVMCIGICGIVQAITVNVVCKVLK